MHNDIFHLLLQRKVIADIAIFGLEISVHDVRSSLMFDIRFLILNISKHLLYIVPLIGANPKDQHKDFGISENPVKELHPREFPPAEDLDPFMAFCMAFSNAP